MFKYSKKIISLSICGLILGGSVTASANTSTNISPVSHGSNINQSTENKSIEITGKTFTYENAPQKVKDYYKKNCESVGVTPKASDEIFIPSNYFSHFNIDESMTRSTETFFIENIGSYIYVSGPKNYSFNINSTYVGYNYTTSGNSVHCLQLLLNIFSYKYSRGNPVAVDSIFGSATHSALVSYQTWAGLSVDATAGPNTWKSLIRYAL